jgi:hypothetical protein
MKIHNPNGLPTLDYRTIKELQGELKDLHHIEQEKLKRVLTEDGFDVPLFVWKNQKDGQYYLLDGHQRVRVMKAYDMNDEGNYHVPVVAFAAPNEQAAKAKLLKITSQYGRITQDGLDEFLALAELPDDLPIHFDALPDYDEMPPPDEKEEPSEREKRSWNIKDLRTKRDSFSEATGSGDNGFVEWLAEHPDV